MDSRDTAFNVFPDLMLIESQSAPFVASEVVIAPSVMLNIFRQRMPITAVAFNGQMMVANCKVASVRAEWKLLCKRHLGFLKRGFHCLFNFAVGHADPCRAASSGTRLELFGVFFPFERCFTANRAVEFYAPLKAFISAFWRAQRLLCSFWSKCFSAYLALTRSRFISLLSAHSRVPETTHFFRLRDVSTFHRAMNCFASGSCHKLFTTDVANSRCLFKHLFGVLFASTSVRTAINFPFLVRLNAEGNSAGWTNFREESPDAVFASFWSAHFNQLIRQNI